MKLFLMADSEPLTPEKCSQHAKSVRDMARRESNPETKKKLDDLAASWEQLCEEIAEIEKRKGK